MGRTWKGCIAVAVLTCGATARGGEPFDGSKWNVSSGNQSVTYIQASPVGAFPRKMEFEAAPPPEVLKKWRELGLVAFEDYVAWGAVERGEGKWDWSQHDRMCEAFHRAGMKYVVYDWVHFPPVWLRDGKKGERTLMKCLEHGGEANYLSIYDPRTLGYYDRFYKALHQHFGDKIDSVYACILGPYGEGNYPLMVPDWVNMGHCHEGYWCGDEFAKKAFRAAVGKKYGAVGKVNAAWGTSFASMEDVAFPSEIKEGFKASPAAFATAGARRGWVDFIEWYHQAIIDFAHGSIEAALKYFPAGKVRTKPGGSAGGVNPIPWGTYCPGYGKMAGGMGVVLQPADCQGAVFADKWVGTAYAYYGTPLGTEPAGNLSQRDFIRRMFSDASAGAGQFFTYEFEAHAADMQKYVALYTGKMSETAVAVYCPTTLYRLGDPLKATIDRSRALRDVADFDVLDELLIRDGALKPKYKVLVVFQSEFVDRSVADKIDAWREAGGTVVMVGEQSPKDLDGRAWEVKGTELRGGGWVKAFGERFKGVTGVDGEADGVWTARRGPQVFRLNTKDAAVIVDGVTIPPHEIVTKE